MSVQRWSDSDLAENPAFAPGTQVAGVCDGLEFTGTVTETRRTLAGAEKVRVEFDPASTVAAGLQQAHGYFFAANLREA